MKRYIRSSKIYIYPELRSLIESGDRYAEIMNNQVSPSDYLPARWEDILRYGKSLPIRAFKVYLKMCSGEAFLSVPNYSFADVSDALDAYLSFDPPKRGYNQIRLGQFGKPTRLGTMIEDALKDKGFTDAKFGSLHRGYTVWVVEFTGR